MFTITVNKPRPDFRVFIDLLFGTVQNISDEWWQNLHTAKRPLTTYEGVTETVQFSGYQVLKKTPST